MSKQEQTFGDRLNNILSEKKVSQKKAADISTVSSSVIYSWKNGTLPTNFIALKKLCDFLDISFTWLLTGEQETEHKATLAEMYEEVPYFNGLARIRIDRLMPIKKDDF